MKDKTSDDGADEDSTPVTGDFDRTTQQTQARRTILTTVPVIPAYTLPDWFCNWKPTICTDDSDGGGCGSSGYADCYGSDYG